MPKPKYAKADCGAPVGAEECRRRQIAMMDALVQICEENHLRCYLSGGTLLGAVRHAGFIPWDDDVDLNMPRPDLDALLKLCKGRLGRYEITECGHDPYAPGCQWTRLYDHEVLLQSAYGSSKHPIPYYYPLFIDVFPIDGFPADARATERFCRRQVFLRKMIGVAWHDRIAARTKKGYVAHVLAQLPAKLIGYNRLRDWFQKSARTYSFDECEYIGATSITMHIRAEKVRKAEYLPRTFVTFEGKTYPAPGNAHTYLTQLYGDYMQLPPPEARATHHRFQMFFNLHPKKGV